MDTLERPARHVDEPFDELLALARATGVYQDCSEIDEESVGNIACAVVGCCKDHIEALRFAMSPMSFDDQTFDGHMQAFVMELEGLVRLGLERNRDGFHMNTHALYSLSSVRQLLGVDDSSADRLQEIPNTEIFVSSRRVLTRVAGDHPFEELWSKTMPL